MPEPGGPVNLPFFVQGQLLVGEYTIHLNLTDSLLASGTPDHPGVGGGGEIEYTFDLQYAPEPSTAALCGGGLLLTVAVAGRQRRARRA